MAQSTVEFFWVVLGKVFETEAEAFAERNALIADGHGNFEVEKYGCIDREVVSVQEAEAELQFQGELRLAEERNRLIDFVG